MGHRAFRNRQSSPGPTTSSQFNGQPRPATLPVKGAAAMIIKEAETVEDIFAKERIPSPLGAIEKVRFAG